MVSFVSGAKAFVAAAAALGMSMPALAAGPATTNAASASDTFRVPDPDKKSDESAIGVANPEFRALFAKWEGKLDNGLAEVSVPALYPLDKKNVRRSSGFGARSAPTRGASTNHKGIDLAAPTGTPIYATADGVVARASWGSGYGKVVYIDHGNEIQTRYAHMSAFNVSADQKVKRGDLIGYVGTTGRSTGPHLHYEVRVSGAAVNPGNFMIYDRTENNLLLASNSSAN